MGENGTFNAAVCIIGIAIFLIHSLDLIFKKNKRDDEKNLLAFFAFTALHFGIYLTFILMKPYFPNKTFIMSFYTSFYIMNNLELLFLFAYTISYIKPKQNVAKALSIVNIVLALVFVALDLGNLLGHYFFYVNDKIEYTRTGIMALSQGYQFIALAIVFILAVSAKRLGAIQKAAFSIYCFLPLLGIILQNLLPGYAIAYLSIIISIEILFLFANVRKNALLAEQQRKNKEAEIRLMMSQIQPHFVYNALSSISTLIPMDPEKAQHALDDFTEYLRANLSSLSDTHLIPFSDELKHIETYLALEKLRFEDRLNVVYDIQERDFLVPPLSIQPIVENAVKHGILQKEDGGTIILRTGRTEKGYEVIIKDNGVGFDVDALDKKGKHVGLKNVSSRVSNMCDGTLKIDSKPGDGTTVTLFFHKEADL